MKNVLITGASQGLGRELAIKLAQNRNHRVILLSRTQLMLQEVCLEIQKKGGKAEYLVCDLRDLEQIKKTVDQINANFKQLDILINNAGVWSDNQIESQNPAAINNVIETNTIGTIQLTESLIPQFVKYKSGHIINIISTAATSDNKAGDNTNWRSYGASKWAMRGYTKDLRNSLSDHGVKVSAFYPGGFDSNLYQNANLTKAHNQPWMMNVSDVAEQVVNILEQPQDVLIEEVRMTKWMK